MSYITVTRCRLCDQKLSPPALVLEDQPAANNLCESEDAALSAPRYPLALARCPGCTSVQLTTTIDPWVLFGDYSYVPTGAAFAAHWEELTAVVGPPKGLAVEIGSNQGDLLAALKGNGWDVLGVEPAKHLAAKANDRGLTALPTFFDEQTAGAIASDHGRAALVVATNVMAHIHDLHGAVRAVKRLLAPDGRFVFEVASLESDYAKGSFDRVCYFEHVFSHSVTPLAHLFSAHGMAITNVEEIQFHGGSLRVTVEHGARHADEIYARARCESLPGQVATAAALDSFALLTHRTISTVRDALADLRRSGKRVVGFTAPAKASVLLNAAGVGQATIQYIADDNPLKVGSYVPGAGIPIVPVSSLLEDHPDVVVVFAWNLADTLIPLLPRGHGLRVVIPMPTWREVIV